MSYNQNGKKRCIVKKLNFEDCVVSNFKGKNRKNVRLRATVCREIEKSDGEEKNVLQGLENFKKSSAGSPVLSSKCGRSVRRWKETGDSETLDALFFSPEKKGAKTAVRSPVLTSRSDEFGRGNLKKSKTVSPVLTPKCRSFTQTRKTNKSQEIKVSLPISPVLSRKFCRSTTKTPSIPAKKKLIMAGSPVLTSKRKREDSVVRPEESPSFVSPNSSSICFSPSQTEEKSEAESDVYRIESATSDEPQPRSSEDVDDFGRSSDRRVWNVRDATEPETPEKNRTEETDSKVLDSGKKRKRFKKKSLCARLENLNKRQVSERRIWEHERKIMKIERNGKINFLVVSVWRDSTWFVLKCRPVCETESEENRFSQNTVLIVDGESVNEVCRVKENSIVSVWPPWREIVLPKLNSTVLVSIVCFEIADRSAFPVDFKIIKSLITNDECKLRDSFIVDCLFSL